MTLKKLNLCLLLPAMMLMLGSCKKWLEVQPEDRFTELQVYQDESGVRAALNGVYLSLAGGSLYGNNLSMSTLDILAQRYNIGAQHAQRPLWSYNYAESGVASRLDGIWTNAYVNIATLNEFLASLDKYHGNWSMKTDSLFRGEALALRAMLHFDVLRMWGPMYNTADSTMPCIPYYRAVSQNINPLLPANQAMDSVLYDLGQALQMLQGDPVRTMGPQRTMVNDGQDFWRNRHQRMNYYAARALEARVQLYRNNKPAALEAATAVINEGVQYFPWITSSAVLSNKDNPNRVFSSELLFGLYAIKMYDNYKSNFAPEIADNSILAPNDTRLKGVYESNESDYRYNPSWILPNVGSKSYRTFFKYADVVNKDSSFRYLVPMLRKSELYYIAAECETDAAKKLQYINTVRFNRGLVDLPATANPTAELEKEYAKEFYGEGQMFFYYKRNNTTRILNATTTNTTYVTMGKLQYVFPLPLSETSFR